MREYRFRDGIGIFNYPVCVSTTSWDSNILWGQRGYNTCTNNGEYNPELFVAEILCQWDAPSDTQTFKEE